MKPKLPQQIPWLPVAVGTAFVLMAVLVLLPGRPADDAAERTLPRASVAPGQTRPETTSASAPASPAETVSRRPLPVSFKSASHEWTEGDATTPEIIQKIAHNPDEFIRMAEENERIKRRQVVYRQDTAAAVVQRARATGEPVRSLTLPGLDGREIDVEVTGSDLALSGLSGTFTGRVAGRQQSIVTLAFKNNREAFSVSSPEDGLYLEAEPREPREVIIKEIDPATYVPGKCGNPDHNH